MKLALRKAILTTALALTGMACSRNKIEAVNLSNEADKDKTANIDGAISKYEQATNLDPTNHRIFFKLARAYQKKEQWDKVASACAKAEKLEPKHADYFALHGIALARQALKGPTTWAEAKAPLEQAIALDDNIADAHFELAEVLLRLDKEAEALAAYSKAIMTKPDEMPFYAALAGLYMRLNFVDQAEQVLTQALSFAKPGDKALFAIHSRIGEVFDRRRDPQKALTSYEAASKACGTCNEPNQLIAYFNLGAAYAMVTPPRRQEAMAQLRTFQKTVCKGAAAQRFADQCMQAQQIAAKLGENL